MKQNLKIEKYNLEWEKTFRCLSSIYQNKLGDLIISIEHVGSTSVKGLSAKPIIDIDIVIENKQLLRPVIKGLEELGYYHEGDLGIKNREAFARTNQNVPKDNEGTTWMAHHLYVCLQNSDELRRHLIFRDYLREHPEAVRAYESLKRELARSTNDRESYTQGKGDFIEFIINSLQEKLK
ncbi:GrpB family protein [Psychrobacillus sp. INOP01]|uniref:GrpB family protein n=1 Tax=Psychrobacillus sp. INOP01 TaxID=2829187 RepID=UPI001BAC09B3|nr:GrpB family protein [Psychrobacillus sp. INOP01]QUG43634.1 GrpB family protein [Psychrobacillus sp. INOP01]